MQILIFEGIATSGKTTLIKKIKELLNGARVEVIDENTTLMPIIQNQDPKVALDFLNAIIFNGNCKEIALALKHRLVT